MRFDQISAKIKEMAGNICLREGDSYILPKNIDFLPAFLDDCNDFHGVLITPFLLNIKNDAICSLCELHCYEFDFEIEDISQSYYIEYPKRNILPKEIIDNIKPRANCAIGDSEFMKDALTKYFVAMKEMSFEDEILAHPEFKKKNLYYQIY
jgi:hypothetical protein